MAERRTLTLAFDETELSDLMHAAMTLRARCEVAACEEAEAGRRIDVSHK